MHHTCGKLMDWAGNYGEYVLDDQQLLGDDSLDIIFIHKCNCAPYPVSKQLFYDAFREWMGVNNFANKFVATKYS